MAKAEQLEGKENPRDVVTNLEAEQGLPRALYEDLYCERGEMENRIKEQLSLFAGRLQDIFRSMKSLLETRPIYPQCDETIRGHVFCSFLVLVLRKELQDRLERKGRSLEWANVIRDLDRLQEVEMSIEGKSYVVRTETKRTVGKVFQACGVALPPTLRSAEAS